VSRPQATTIFSHDHFATGIHASCPRNSTATRIEFDVRTDEMLVNMGPQHPSTHGVLRLVLRTDGEIVSEVDAAHRLPAPLRRKDRREPHAAAVDSLHRPHGLPGGDEHESRLVADRREAAERTRPPEKARHLRVIIAEMGRIASHLVGMGAYGLDLGSFSPFLYAFREREKILDLFEEACGARLTYSYLTPGGATADLPRGWLQKCEAFLDQFEPVITEYHTLLTTNAIFIKRTATSASCRPRWRSTTAAPARCCAAAASITTSAATARRSTPRCTTATRSR
jgi:NADH-quinone oxidoreductase subunit D